MKSIVTATAIILTMSGCAIPFAHDGLSDGLVAHYEFNGNANDSSINGNNGMVRGAKPTADRFGNPNGAYTFGKQRWIEVADSPTLQSVTNTMTYSVWINWEKYDGGWLPILSKGVQRRQFSFELSTVPNVCDTMFINDYNGTGSGKSVTIKLPLGTFRKNVWCHFAASYDGKTMRGYINGELIATVTVEDSVSPNSSPLYIGTDLPEVQSFFNGSIDDIRIYNRVLSDDEIATLARL